MISSRAYIMALCMLYACAVSACSWMQMVHGNRILGYGETFDVQLHRNDHAFGAHVVTCSAPTTIDAGTVSLDSGQQLLKLVIEGDDFNLTSLVFQKAEAPTPVAVQHRAQVTGIMVSATSSRTIQVRFGLPRAGRVQIALYDMHGKRQAVLVDRTMAAAGNHRQVLETGHMAAGAYIVRMDLGGEVAARRIVVGK